MLPLILTALLSGQSVPPGELPVDPYVRSDANAGATPFRGTAMWRAFHGSDGVTRIVDRTIDLSVADRRIAEIFRNQDIVRLRRTLREQFCYILNGGCAYTGRTMADAHRDMGLQTADMSALVENLQAAMRTEHVAFRAQNRLLVKLAPMRRVMLQASGRHAARPQDPR